MEVGFDLYGEDWWKYSAPAGVVILQHGNINSVDQEWFICT